MDPLTVAVTLGAGVVALGTRWFVARYASHGTGLEQLRKAKRYTVADVNRDGQRVRVDGTVSVVGEPLLTPFGQTPCAAYRVRLIALEEHGPRELVDETEHVAFRLQDETGVARVGGSAIRLVVPARRVLTQGGGGRLHPELRVFLREHGLRAAMGEHVVVEQAVLEVGARAAALGCSQRVVDPSRAGRTYREPGRELRLEDLPQGPVIVGAADGGLSASLR